MTISPLAIIPDQITDDTASTSSSPNTGRATGIMYALLLWVVSESAMGILWQVNRGGTSLVTIEPAATRDPLPILTPGSIVAFAHY